MSDNENVKPKKPKRKGAGGRPSNYKPEHVEQAFKYALLGATDVRMAELFGTSLAALSRWKKRYSEFREAIKRGRDRADAEITGSLYHSAKGYEYDDVQAIKVKEVKYENGKRLSEIEHVELVTVHRVLPPVPVSMIYWLNNRQKELWRNRNDHTTNGKDLPAGNTAIAEEDLDARIEKLIARREA